MNNKDISKDLLSVDKGNHKWIFYSIIWIKEHLGVLAGSSKRKMWSAR